MSWENRRKWSRKFCIRRGERRKYLRRSRRRRRSRGWWRSRGRKSCWWRKMRGGRSRRSLLSRLRRYLRSSNVQSTKENVNSTNVIKNVANSWWSNNSSVRSKLSKKESKPREKSKLQKNLLKLRFSSKEDFLKKERKKLRRREISLKEVDRGKDMRCRLELSRKRMK